MNRESSRSAILGRIRDGLGNSAEHRLQRFEEEWQGLPRAYCREGAVSESALLRLFVDRLRHYETGVFQGNIPEAPSIIRSILAEKGRTRLVIAAGIPPEWIPNDIETLRDGTLQGRDLDGVDGVITMCTAAIATTGTIILVSGDTDGHRASTLVPDYHLCLVPVGSLVETVPEAIARLATLKRKPLTFVSGPSATVDIEMVRVKGVHGPRTMDVLLIGDF